LSAWTVAIAAAVPRGARDVARSCGARGPGTAGTVPGTCRAGARFHVRIRRVADEPRCHGARMRLFTYAGSANGYKVELLLSLLDRRYFRIEVSIFEGEARTAAFLARNPVGRVPVLERDDGTNLPESNAILWHLARGTSYLPAADEDRILAWLLFEQSEVEPVIGSARFWRLTGRDDERGDELVRRQAWGARTLEVLDGVLAAAPFLVGAAPTIADLAVYGYVHLAPDAGLALGAHVAAWCRRIEALPGYLAGPASYDRHAHVPPRDRSG
jgi:glutathione S-transferase